MFAAKLLQSCPTLCDTIDGRPPGCPLPGILQARTLEWVAISFSNAWKWKVKVKSLSRVWLFETPWSAAYQAPLPMGFSRQEYWSGLPSPSPMTYLQSRYYGILLLLRTLQMLFITRIKSIFFNKPEQVFYVISHLVSSHCAYTHTLCAYTHTHTVPTHTHTPCLHTHTHTHTPCLHIHTLRAYTHTHSPCLHTYTNTICAYTHTYTLCVYTHTHSVPIHTHTTLCLHMHTLCAYTHTHTHSVPTHTHTLCAYTHKLHSACALCCC